MPKGDIETYREGDQWKNWVLGSEPTIIVHRTRAEAIAEGRSRARDLGVAHVVTEFEDATEHDLPSRDQMGGQWAS